MRNFTLLFIFLLVPGRMVAADASAKEAVKNAIQKLATARNYTWTATPSSAPGSANWRQGPTEGKTSNETGTYLQLTVGDNDVEIAFRGNKVAIKREGVWESADELTGGDAWIAQRLKVYKVPAAEAEDLLGKTKNLDQQGGVYTGALREDAVKDLLTLGGREGNAAPEVTGAKGSVKFWVKGGLLSKYELNLQGKVSRRDQDPVELNRTTTVEIKDVGSTKVDLPASAQKKL